jgi:hypothetical protein
MREGSRAIVNETDSHPFCSPPTVIEKAAAPKPLSPVKHSGPPIVPRFATVVQSMARAPKKLLGKASSAKAKVLSAERQTSSFPSSRFRLTPPSQAPAVVVAPPVAKPIAVTKSKVTEDPLEFDASIFPGSQLDEASRQSLGVDKEAQPAQSAAMPATVQPAFQLSVKPKVTAQVSRSLHPRPCFTLVSP